MASALPNTFDRDLDAFAQWFATLDGPARAAVLGRMARLASPHELAVMMCEKLAKPLPLQPRRPPAPPGPTPTPPWPRDTSDPQWLHPWLRAMRLHKFTSALDGLLPAALRQLDHAALERLGVDSIGARTKLLKAIQAADTADAADDGTRPRPENQGSSKPPV